MKKLFAALAPAVIAFTALAATPALASDEGPDDYFVIVGSFSAYGSGHYHAQQRLARVQACGLANAHIVATNEYPNLRNGLYAVVLGTYTWGRAHEELARARYCISDAYVKSGW